MPEGPLGNYSFLGHLLLTMTWGFEVRTILSDLAEASSLKPQAQAPGPGPRHCNMVETYTLSTCWCCFKDHHLSSKHICLCFVDWRSKVKMLAYLESPRGGSQFLDDTHLLFMPHDWQDMSSGQGGELSCQPAYFIYKPPPSWQNDFLYYGSDQSVCW